MYQDQNEASAPPRNKSCAQCAASDDGACDDCFAMRHAESKQRADIVARQRRSFDPFAHGDGNAGGGSYKPPKGGDVPPIAYNSAWGHSELPYIVTPAVKRGLRKWRDKMDRETQDYARYCRKCPEGKRTPIGKRQRMCNECRERNRKHSNRIAKRKERNVKCQQLTSESTKARRHD